MPGEKRDIKPSPDLLDETAGECLINSVDAGDQRVQLQELEIHAATDPKMVDVMITIFLPTPGTVRSWTFPLSQE
ncbi:hypothetical protein J6590_101814 [Homalodisca vitripennis]|nr:hypothetical protein J6590_101814 [Homalodisca vitripennis]